MILYKINKEANKQKGIITISKKNQEVETNDSPSFKGTEK